jgi:SAM-dependent methyltransferase
MLRVEEAVLDRYSRGAEHREEELCCPVEYNRRYLEVVPNEIIERDYGCGDPSAHLRPGESVLDLGSGSGKICFIAAQVVGPNGRVIGVDMNADMLALARRYQPEVARRLGYDNVTFVRGKIQDLRSLLARSLEAERTAKSRRNGQMRSSAGKASAKRRQRRKQSTPLEFWHRLQGRLRVIPDEALDRLPRNGALNHDRYIYGRPCPELAVKSSS